MPSPKAAFLVVACLIVVGCSTQSGVAAGERATALAPQGGPAIAGGKDGLTVVVTLGRDTVEPGDSVEMLVTVSNVRPTPATIGFGTCGAGATVYADMPVPWTPSGRSWDGVAGAFKRYALETGMQPGAVAASLPYRVTAKGEACPEETSDPFSGIALGTGESKTDQLTLAADILPGIVALPGVIPIHADVAYDPPERPAPKPCEGICPSTTVIWKSFTANGTVRVVGDGPRAISAGQAIDALLADAAFHNWLALQPIATWSAANVFLESSPTDVGFMPRGAYWEIELFREIGVPRNWAFGFVDAFSGEVRHVEYCNDPCEVVSEK
jgi:hypothetical protein